MVLAHMRGADRSTWEPFAEVAAGNGFRVLTFDFRGYGGSDGERDTLLDVDLTAAVEHLQREGAEHIVVMGASMGGTATINVASRLDLAGASSLSLRPSSRAWPRSTSLRTSRSRCCSIAAEDDQPYAGAAVSISQIAPDNRLEHPRRRRARHQPVLRPPRRADGRAARPSPGTPAARSNAARLSGAGGAGCWLPARTRAPGPGSRAAARARPSRSAPGRPRPSR